MRSRLIIPTSELEARQKERISIGSRELVPPKPTDETNSSICYSRGKEGGAVYYQSLDIVTRVLNASRQ